MNISVEFQIYSDSDGVSNKSVIELEKILKNSSPEVEINIKKDNSETMSLGTILTAVFSKEAVSNIINGLFSFLAKRPNVKITVKIGDVSVETEGVSPADFESIFRAAKNV